MQERRFLNRDFRRTNNDLIELTTNSGKVIFLERIHGIESLVTNEKGKFDGWIEVNPRPKLDKKPLEDAPFKIAVKSNQGETIKYTECTLADKPLPAEEKTQNDAFGIKGTIS